MGRLYFPAFDTPATNNGVAEGLDGEGVRQFYGRLDFKGLTVTGAYGSRRRDVPTASFGTVFNEQETREQTTDRHTLVDAEYGRSFGGTRVTFRASFDRFTFDGTYPFAGEPEGAPTLVAHNSGVGTRWSVGSGLTRSFGARHTVRAGVEFIDNVHQDQTARYVDPPVLLLDSPRSSMQHAVYAQDEIRLARWLIVNAGLRYDGYEKFQRVTPRAALIVLPSSTQSVKYLYGQRISFAECIRVDDRVLWRTGQRSASRIDRHARARLGTLCQRLAAHLGFDVLVQGRAADHPGPRRLGVSGPRVRQPGGSPGEGPRARSADAPQGRIAGVGELRPAKRGGAGDARPAPELAETYRQGTNQSARSNGSVLRVRGGTVSQQPRHACRPRRCRRRQPSTSPWSSHSDAPGSSPAACETSSTPGIQTPFRVSTGRTPSPRTAERLGSDSAGGCGRTRAIFICPGVSAFRQTRHGPAKAGHDV